MRWFALLGVVLAGAFGLLVGAAPEADPGPPTKGFAVHEWGVFSVMNDAAHANADRRAEFEGLPKFMYGQMSTRELPRHFIPRRVRKPVVFFHAPGPMTVEFRVAFAEGLPLVWWPATETPSIDDALGVQPANGPPARELFWRLYLQKPPNPGGKAAELKEVGTGHWVKALREVKADTVFAEVGQRGLESEREQFVYYDGLMPRGKGAAITVEKDRVSLTNEAKHALYDITVVDRRTPTKPRVARVAKLDAGAKQDADLADPAEPRWPEKAMQTLQDQLKDAGLNDDEAKSLAVVWKGEFFEADGVTLFYRLPQEEYERLLPATIKPRPEKLVRVGLMRHIHCEPGLAERVAKLVAQLNDDEFNKREAAQKELDRLGRGALPYLKKMRPNLTAAEVQRRVDELLEKHDVERAVRK
jgi:hypothetical protein